MFADSLLESAPHLGQRSAWAKLVSVLLQSLALAAALAIPLLHIERLQISPPPPSIRLTSAAPAEARPTAEHLTGRRTATTAYQILQPQTILSFVTRAHGRDQGPPDLPSLGQPCAANCNGVSITDLVKPGSFHIALPPPAPGPVHVSQVQLGELIHKVLPQYPILAKQVGVHGQVVLMAIIGKDGRVEQLKAISGHPMLVPSALLAVQQWQYRPYLLNHEAVEVQTQITVNFVLNSQ